MNVQPNDFKKADQTASAEATTLGPFLIYPVHTRHDAVAWFVTDDRHVNHRGLRLVVGQHKTEDEAIAAARFSMLREAALGISACLMDGAENIAEAKRLAKIAGCMAENLRPYQSSYPEFR